MQKFLAIFAALALVATSVFAFDVSAGGGGKATLLNGNTEDDDLHADIIATWFWMGVEKVNDENTAGAKLGLSIDVDPGAVSGSAGDTWFYAWWYPMEQIFLKIGKVGEDGKYFSGGGIMGWDFQSNDMMISPDFLYYNGFAGSLLPDGFGYFGGIYGDMALQLSILPMDGFAINFGWALEGDDITAAYIDNLSVQFVYDIPGAGQAALGFVNANADAVKDEGAERNLYIQYKHPLGDMKIEAGIHIPLGDELNRINVGIGFGYGSPWGDQFWLNARVGAMVPLKDYIPMIIGVDVCPSYDLGMFRFYMPVGVAFASGDFIEYMSGGEKSLLGWSVNPYIRKDLGGVEFWAGLKLYNGAQGGWHPQGSEVPDPISVLGYGTDDDNYYYPGVRNKDQAGQINYDVSIGFLWAW